MDVENNKMMFNEAEQLAGMPAEILTDDVDEAYSLVQTKLKAFAAQSIELQMSPLHSERAQFALSVKNVGTLRRTNNQIACIFADKETKNTNFDSLLRDLLG